MFFNKKFSRLSARSTRGIKMIFEIFLKIRKNFLGLTFMFFPNFWKNFEKNIRWGDQGKKICLKRSPLILGGWLRHCTSALSEIFSGYAPGRKLIFAKWHLTPLFLHPNWRYSTKYEGIFKIAPYTGAFPLLETSIFQKNFAYSAFFLIKDLNKIFVECEFFEYFHCKSVIFNKKNRLRPASNNPLQIAKLAR